jgi:hypothetical protein
MRRQGDGRHIALRRLDGITVSEGDGGENARGAAVLLAHTTAGCVAELDT